MSHPSGARAVALGLVVAWLVMAVSGCRLLSSLVGRPSDREAGPMQVAVYVPAEALVSLPAQPPMDRVRVTLVKDAYVLSQQQPLSAAAGEQTYSFRFDRVYEGTWDVGAEVLDVEGDVPYGGYASVTIVAGGQAEVDVRAVARPATLRVSIDLAGYPEQGLVTGAGITLKRETSSTLQQARPGDALTWQFQRERLPGTYDARVALYRADGAVQLTSPWRHGLVLLPGKLTALHWSPAAGTLSVNAVVDGIPLPPDPVTCQPLPAERLLRVGWTPCGEPDVQGHRIYVRLPGDVPLRMVGDVPLPARSADIQLDGLPWDRDADVYVGVTAVDAIGQESLHAAGLCSFDAAQG
ncbi:MAG: hypothetical protein IMX02_08915 [Limnochordaceae bacterium]|nr:hypothetical protein [Limnochordaceae bacterium]